MIGAFNSHIGFLPKLLFTPGRTGMRTLPLSGLEASFTILVKIPVYSAKHCCPNLNLQRIGRGAHKGLHLQVLLQALEEQLNLPPILVDRANRCAGQREIVGHKLNLTLVSLIPYRNQPQHQGMILVFQLNRPAKQHRITLCHLEAVQDPIGGVVLDATDKEDPLSFPLLKQGEVEVASIDSNDAPLGRDML